MDHDLIKTRRRKLPHWHMDGSTYFLTFRILAGEFTTAERITKGINGVAARMVNQAQGTRGTLWQEETFDRIMPNAEEFEQKLVYIVSNPVKRELVKDPWEYPALLVIGTAG